MLCYFGSLFGWKIVIRTIFVFCRYRNFLFGLWPLASHDRVALIIRYLWVFIDRWSHNDLESWLDKSNRYISFIFLILHYLNTFLVSCFMFKKTSKILRSFKIFPNTLSNYSYALVVTQLGSELFLLRMTSKLSCQFLFYLKHSKTFQHSTHFNELNANNINCSEQQTIAKHK